MDTIQESCDTKTKLTRAFLADTEGLQAIHESGNLSELIAHFNDYNAYLKTHQKSINSHKLIRKLSKGTGLIDGSLKSTGLRDIFYAAHIAACCAMFRQGSLPLGQLDRSGLEHLITNTLSSQMAASPSNIRDIENRIHISDAVRSIQILRMMGLLKRSSSQMRQLSLAAGSGNRDLEGVHAIPRLGIERSHLSEVSSIRFDLEISTPESLVLIDNDPELGEHYSAINQSDRDWLLAMNTDSDTALSQLPDIIQDRHWAAFNAVVGIRIDHRMIPNVDRFFKSLVPIIDDNVDFIISIGAGHSVEEFSGRKEVMQAIFDYLQNKKLSPVKITLHKNEDGIREKQRISPYFGLSNFTTYELLHCKLKRKNI